MTVNKGIIKTLTAFVVMAGLMGGLVGVPSVSAAESGNALEITPSGTRLTLEPGDVMVEQSDNCPTENENGCAISVRNIGNATIRYKVYASPYAVQGEENELSFSEEASTTYTQLSKWITIRNDAGEYVKEAEFSIKPDEKQVVYYKIDVPEEIPGGSQYAVIWAQLLGNSDDASGGIETIGQVGAVLTGRSTVDIVETAVISDYDFTKFTFSAPLYAQATIENTGNVDFMAHSTYTAKTIFGKELFSKEVKIAAYPGTTYHVNVEWSKEDGNAPFMGIFHVEWKVKAADAEMVESKIVMIMPVIVIIVMVLLLTVLIIWTIIIIRKRKERKARKLV